MHKHTQTHILSMFNHMSMSIHIREGKKALVYFFSCTCSKKKDPSVCIREFTENSLAINLNPFDMLTFRATFQYIRERKKL